MEESIIAAIGKDMDNLFSVTLERVQEESLKDDGIRSVVNYVVKGFPSSKSEMNPKTADFWKH